MSKKNKKIVLGFDLVVLGQVTAGKDTQSEILMKKYAFKPVESGKHWRKMLKSKTPDGDLLRKTTGKGWAAPVKLMKKFIIDQLAKKPKKKDLIFIGNPRLKPEAQLLNKLLKAKKEQFFAIYISLPDKEIYRRSHLRGEGVGNMSEASRIFDRDKQQIINRIKWHKEQVSLAVAYFESIGKLKRINGNQSIDKVTADIEKAIQMFKKQSTQQ